MNKNPRNNDTDWGNEVAHSVGLIGKIFGKIFSYVLNILLTVLLIGLITGTIVGGAFAIYVTNYVDADLEGFDFLATNQDLTTKIYYMDYSDRENRIGVPVELEDQRIYGAENRIWASYNDMPKYLVDAFVAVEDKRFWEHGGVDWLRTTSAVVNWVIGGSTRFGASTITQQLIKNVTGDDDITMQRKIQEILRALELEKTKDKTEIIELYLNTIFLSQRSSGVQAAAYTYFGKDVSELTLIECAAIAAIPQYPTRYDPYQYPENNKERRNSILTLMLDQGLITQQEFDLAYNKDLVLNMQTNETQETGTSTLNSWYQDQVIEDAITLLMDAKGITREIASKMVYTQGLQIYTVMDPDVQNTLEEIFSDPSRLFGDEYVDEGIIKLESAMVIIDPSTGDILGLIGGREKTVNRAFNYATQGKRPPGSSIKPITVYAPSIDSNVITYGSVLDDTPFDFGDETTVNGVTTYSNLSGWPQNYPKRYDGLTTVAEAVRISKNTVAVKVLDKLTPQKSFDFATQKVGLSLVEAREIGGGKYVTDIAYAPLALGELSYGISVKELTAAYAIFVNKGVYNEPRTIIKILDSNGEVIIDNSGTGTVAISESTATIMTKLLQGVVESGTGSRVTLRNKIDVAGKTGTTSADNDRWFVGYTPYYVAGLWIGYQTPKSLVSVNTSLSSIVWNNVMTELHQKYIDEANSGGASLKKFTDASNVIVKEYCMDSGMMPSEACKIDYRGSRVATGYFTYATAPTQTCNVHVVVDYDLSTGGVASVNCPETTKISLVRVTSRNFPTWITITDAQYTYRDVPEGVSMSMVSNEPFYMNAMPEGTYPGRSGTDNPVNRYCKTHHSDEPIEPIDEPDDEDIDPDADPDPDISQPIENKNKDNETQPDNSIDNTEDNTTDPNTNTDNITGDNDEEDESGPPDDYEW